MSAVFGLCGIHCTENGIEINPHLPAHWKEVIIPLIVRGQELQITLTHEKISVQARRPLQIPLNISVGKTIVQIPAAQEIGILLS